MSDKMTDTKMIEGFAKEFKPFVGGMIYFDDHASRFRACEPYTIGADSAAATINYKWIGWKAAWQAARTVPEGFVMVPVEPTSDMVCAAIDAGTIDDDDVLWVWGEMLSAAQEPKK